MLGFDASGERIISPDVPLDEFGLPLNPHCPHLDTQGLVRVEIETFPSAMELGYRDVDADTSDDWQIKVFLDSFKASSNINTIVGGEEDGS
jgi:hypothetical protein